MWEVFSVFAIMLLALAFLFYALMVKKNPMIKLAVTGEDDDIKIADGSFREPKEDSDDEAATEFLRQKEAGNIETARQLGDLLAGEVWNVAQELLMNDDDQYTPVEIHQQILLYTYAVDCFIADSSPYEIIAETALSTFYSKLEERSSILYQHVSDTPSFSFYVLNERANNKIDEIGKIYAKLCGEEGNADREREGNVIFVTFYKFCKENYETDAKYC